eukprot:6190758-Pleurochrysis_carterae.AAC.1
MRGRGRREGGRAWRPPKRLVRTRSSVVASDPPTQPSRRLSHCEARIRSAASPSAQTKWRTYEADRD